ncbi:MAG: two-component system response regulator [bacterium]|nr:two-component system response regulator [bacterium]
MPDPQLPLILAVDDTPANLTLLTGFLKSRYRLRLATSAGKALELAATFPLPDLILLDIMMPEMNGYEVLTELKSNPLTADIPVMFLTAKSEVDDEYRGLTMGAVDYITKPIFPLILMARVEAQLTLQKARKLLQDQNACLEEMVVERTHEIELARDAIIYSMACLAETRDNETGNHIRRTQAYVRLLAQALLYHKRFRDELDDEKIELLYKSAPLHDIGKIGVPDHVLLKPGKLDAAEWEIMKRHTVYGRDAIIGVEAYMGGSNAFLRYAREIAYSHQEKWDGSGYPEGLKGEEIPLSARLMAVADVYDALISERVYKRAFSHEEALALMKEGRGAHFDPDILDAFLVLETEFRDVAEQFRDCVRSEVFA